MDEVFERIPGISALAEAVPGGGWTVATIGLLLLPRARRAVRPVAKLAVRGGLALKDGMSEVVREAREGADDLVAEAKSERATA